MAGLTCDACRFRKTKCERREDGGCVQCKRKGLECVTSRLTRKPYKSRTGKRIETFKELQKNGATQDLSLVAFGEMPVISSSLAASKIASLEESDAFANNLVEMYFSSLSHALPTEKWSQIRHQFDLAGRRLSQIEDPTTEVLLRCAMAFGAYVVCFGRDIFDLAPRLVSDCPALVGKDAPSLRNFGQFRGLYLDTYGQRRFATAKRLYDQAIASVDSRGMFRSSSPDAVSVLLICFELRAYFNSTVQIAHYPTQPYIDAVVSTMKKNAMPGTSDYSQSSICGNTYCTWTAAAVEAAHSALHGNESAISERQLPWFFGPLRYLERGVPFDQARIQQIATAASGSEDMIEGSAKTLWYKVYRVLRNIGDNVAVPIKWEDHLPDTAIMQVMDQMESVHQFIDTSSQGMRTSPYAAALPGRAGITRDLVAAELTTSAALRLLHFQIDKYKGKTAQQNCHPFFADQNVTERLRVAEGRLNHLLTLTARRMAACIASQDLLSVVYFNSPLSIGSSMPGFWAGILLASRCSIEGGLLDWSAEDKAQEIQCLVDALKAQTWIWPARSQQARELEQSLNGFKALWLAPAPSLALMPPIFTQVDTASTGDMLLDPFKSNDLFSTGHADLAMPFPSNVAPLLPPALRDTFDAMDFLDMDNANLASQFQAP